jgi:hypothetical protein
MRTRAERRKLFPPRALVRRPRMLAGLVGMGLSPKAAGKQLGFTPVETAQALSSKDFQIALADITALVVKGVDAMNADLVVSARFMLEQMVYECEPRVLLYLCHCHAEGKNGLALIVESAERALAQLRAVGDIAETLTVPLPEPETMPPPRSSKYWRKPVSRLDANTRRINLDLRDRLLAAYASLTETRAAEAAKSAPTPAARRWAIGYVSSKDELLAALDAHVAGQKVQHDSS